MRVLVIFDHPRRDSFCGAVLDSFVSGLKEAGHSVEIADLYREDFDPRMTVEDEPDWGDASKQYSPTVINEQARVARNDALVLLFPVWWWSLPAMSKGWIDRVLNNGWAYGPRKLPHRNAMFLAIASSTEAAYAKREYDRSMRISLEQGILRYCGIEDAKLQFLFGSLESAQARETLIDDARGLARNF